MTPLDSHDMCLFRVDQPNEYVVASALLEPLSVAHLCAGPLSASSIDKFVRVWAIPYSDSVFALITTTLAICSYMREWVKVTFRSETQSQ